MSDVAAKNGPIGPDGQALADPSLLDDPAWFLDRLDFQRGVAVLTRTNRKAVSDAVFLDDRWDRAGAPQRAVSLSHLRGFQAHDPAPVILWHTAFCCSTLIASCLDAPGVCLALKEPLALVDLSSARRRGVEAADSRLATAVFSHIGRGFSAGERGLIKPSNGALSLLADASALSAPMLMLYSSCRDFILSIASGGERRRHFVKGLMIERLITRRQGLRWGPDQLLQMTDLQVAALLWHTQAEELRAVARTAGRQRARSLDCDQFLAHPADTLQRIDQFFGLGLGQVLIDAVVRGPKLSQYSKQPDLAFDANHRRQGFREIEAVLGPDLDALVEWSYRVCPDTPPGDPVGAALVDSA